MTEFPKVSVVTITYGHEKYITQTLDGVLMQDYPGGIEFIIANDLSPDQTDEVIKHYFETHLVPENFEIKYTKHEANKGMMPNFIWAMEQASGKYIALCEGDDYWTDPLKLQKQVDFLEANPEYVLTFHPVEILKPDGSLVKDFITTVPENYELQENLARHGNYIHTPSVVFRNILRSFPPEFWLSPIGDFFLYMILTNHGIMKMIDDEMAVYRYNVGVISRMNGMDIAKNNIKMYSCMLSALDNFEIKEIIFERQLAFLNSYYDQIESKYVQKYKHLALVPNWYIYNYIRLSIIFDDPKGSFKRLVKKNKKLE